MKTKQEKLTKIDKERRMLMNLLAKLRVEITFHLQDRNKDMLDELFKWRKNYRKRLTKLTNKRRKVREEA